MVHNRNIDFIEEATIVTDPLSLKGNWTQILCLTDCTGVDITDENLKPLPDGTPSELWSDAEFLKTAIIVGRFKKITLTGKVVLYA